MRVVNKTIEVHYKIPFFSIKMRLTCKFYLKYQFCTRRWKVNLESPLEKKIEALWYIVQGLEVFYLFIQDLLKTYDIVGVMPGSGNKKVIEDSLCCARAVMSSQ